VRFNTSQQYEAGHISNSVELGLSAHCTREKMCETGSNLEDKSLPLPTSLSFFVFTVEGGNIQQASSGIEAWLLFSDKTCYHTGK
jgi:hypothetical protein